MINLTKQQMQMFDGIMISDGCLTKQGRSKNARFVLTTSKREFAEKVMQLFPNFPWSEKSLRTFDRYDKRTGKSHSSTVLRSRVSDFFTKQRKRWYPDGKKIVPVDIEIDKNMLLWWYIGDGFLYRKKSRPNYRRAYLATDSFTNGELEFLIGKLKLFLDRSNILIENKEIAIGRKALVKFAQVLGPKSPIVDYQYKFEFGRYFKESYFKDSFKTRPIHYINEFRKKNKVRELNFISKEDIRKVG